MVFFNDPVPIERPAEAAVRMALAMQRGLPAAGRGVAASAASTSAWAAASRRATPRSGAIGFEGRWDYAAIGNVTNLAARLCAEAAGGQVLVDRKIMAKVGDLVEATPVGPLTLKGFTQPVPAFSVTRIVAPV